jgi:hypothetical protein
MSKKRELLLPQLQAQESYLILTFHKKGRIKINEVYNYKL